MFDVSLHPISEETTDNWQLITDSYTSRPFRYPSESLPKQPEV